MQRRAPIYDKSQDGHYNLISALHKSVRGSDPDAALYYLARMLDAGEDPLYLARRMVRMAVEDIGWPTACAGDLQCREGRLRFSRIAGGRARDRAGGDLSRDRAEIERGYTAFGAAKRAAKEAARCCRRSTSSMRRPS